MDLQTGNSVEMQVSIVYHHHPQQLLLILFSLIIFSSRIFFSAVTSVFYTHDQYVYDQVWLSVIDQNSVVFKARACSDVHVGLARYPGISYVEMYEVVIGGWDNSKSVIRTGMQQSPKAELDERDMVDCEKSRPFWVSWIDGRIAFGRGTIVGSREYLYWQDPNPHEVTGVGITNAAGYNGTWEFGLPGRKYFFHQLYFLISISVLGGM